MLLSHLMNVGEISKAPKAANLSLITATVKTVYQMFL